MNGAGELEEEGDVRIDLSLSMKKRVMHSENKKEWIE